MENISEGVLGKRFEYHFFRVCDMVHLPLTAVKTELCVKQTVSMIFGDFDKKLDGGIVLLL